MEQVIEEACLHKQGSAGGGAAHEMTALAVFPSSLGSPTSVYEAVYEA